MKKKKLNFKSIIELKIYRLFLLEHIRYPIDKTTLIDIISENTEELVLDYETSLAELADAGHVWYDNFEGETYYMISDTGRYVANELFDSIDEEFREMSIQSTIRHLSLAKIGAKIESEITETPIGKFNVTVKILDSDGEMMATSMVVSSRSEAEKIRDNFRSRPEGIYKGIFFALTGRLEFLG